MHYWLVKSDPEEYAAQDLARDGETSWSGVTNALAQQHIRSMQLGDRVLVYHTGSERAVVAVATAASAPSPDPEDKTAKLHTVRLAFEGWLKTPIELARIKSDPTFAEFGLVRIGRLSVMPVAPALWKKLLTMGGGVRAER